MKKRLALITVLIIAGICVLFFIRVSTQAHIVVRTSLINTVKELTSPTEWQRWHPALVKECAGKGCTVTLDSAAKSFTIQSKETILHVVNQGFNVLVTETTGGHTNTYSYDVIPTMRQDSTGIVIISSESVLQSFFRGSTPGEVAAMDSLQSYIETTSKFYGFNIEKQRVADTIVAITRRVVSLQNQLPVLPAMQQSITGYIAANHLAVLEPCIVHYQELTKDSVEIMMGIAVNKTTVPQNNVAFMQMPYGNVLVGDYKGSFAGRKALYNAMNKYMRDHFLQGVAATFEKYMDNVLPVNDSSQVSMKLYYPIY